MCELCVVWLCLFCFALTAPIFSFSADPLEGPWCLFIRMDSLYCKLSSLCRNNKEGVDYSVFFPTYVESPQLINSSVCLTLLSLSVRLCVSEDF
jgi:hypothetical protein